jgi:hypothetical protein
MKHLVGKVITKKVPFMGDEVEVRKMSVHEVMKVQDMVKKSNKSKAEDAQIGLLRDVIRLAVIGAEEISDEDFNTFPIGELSDLSNEILAFSGLGDASAGN